MYYPQSQIKTNLYTNGGEFILSTTGQEYTGYYYKLSNGKAYTGKSPNEKPNILLTTSIKQNNNELTVDNTSIGLFETYMNNEYFINKKQKFNNRIIPQFQTTQPTTKDYDLGTYQRYFCKKNNELIYNEIDRDTYNLLKIQSPTIAWDLYSPLYTMWYIKGNKEQIYKINKNLISLIEKNERWYGFSQYFKEDYLKFYLES